MSNKLDVFYKILVLKYFFFFLVYIDVITVVEIKYIFKHENYTTNFLKTDSDLYKYKSIEKNEQF